MRILCEETTFLEDGCPDRVDKDWSERNPDPARGSRRHRSREEDGDFTEMVDPYTKTKRVSGIRSMLYRFYLRRWGSLQEGKGKGDKGYSLFYCISYSGGSLHQDQEGKWDKGYPLFYLLAIGDPYTDQEVK